MAVNLISRVNKSKQINNFKNSRRLLVSIVMLFWLENAKCIPHFNVDDLCGVQMFRKTSNCSHGSFIVNPDPRFCADNEICYLGLGEPCRPNVLELRCARGLACKCGRCMNCMGDDCNMEVWCQSKPEVPKRFALTPYENNLWRFFYNRAENQFN